MAKRTWTYEELTKITEQSIRRSMTMAANSQAKGDSRSAGHFAAFAWGRFCMWNDITMGWQTPGDEDRLYALTEVQHG